MGILTIEDRGVGVCQTELTKDIWQILSEWYKK